MRSGRVILALLAGLATAASVQPTARPQVAAAAVHGGVLAATISVPAVTPTATAAALPVPAAPSDTAVSAIPPVSLTPGPGTGLNLAVIDNGVTAADLPARQLMIEVLGSTTGPDRARLLQYTVRLVIIPAGRSLTDLADFRDLAGRQTFDGRNYSTLRAVGPTIQDGVVVYAVGAEQVVPGGSSAYGSGFAVAHESGHVVRHVALSRSEDATLRNLYAAHHATGGPWLTDYASSNDDEYFADSTAAYFGHAWSDSTAPRFTETWLRVNDPGMFALLRQVYGG